MKSEKLPEMTKWPAGAIKNRPILVRLDTNVPIKAGRVVNGFRLEQSRSTLDWLIKRGAKPIIIGHAGGDQSLRPAAGYFKGQLDMVFTDLAKAAGRLDKLKPGQILWLENLRFDPGEEANSRSLAKKLAGLADGYVNEAFSASHRRHASIVGLPKLLPAAAGRRFVLEYQTLSRALKPESPFVCLIGGAKFSTKLPLVKKLSHRADHLFIGGALAHTLLHRLGYPVGRSLLETAGRGLLPVLRRSNLLLPTDMVVKTAVGRKAVRLPEAVKDSDTIYDAGPATLDQLKPIIKQAKFILWNGPVGNFEAGFAVGTEEIARLVAASRAYSLVGGGDTIVTVEKLALTDKFNFVSTAGGAMLDFLTKETLPGIEALKHNSRSLD